MDYGRLELADRLAAEYACGLLRGPARRRFEALLPAHPALRAALRDWRDRLMPLTLAVAPIEPSANLWPRIAAAIDPARPAQSTAGTARGWLAGLAFWRLATAVAGVAVLGLALRLATPSPVQPPIVVVLAPATPVSAVAGADAGGIATAGFVAGISADGRALVTRPLRAAAPSADHALELWSLPTNGSAPRSLGLIASDRATVVERDRVLDGTGAFAVSLEPPGGSRTGAPTGPVLYVGKLGT